MYIKVTGIAKVTKIREGKTKDNEPILNVTAACEMTTTQGNTRTTTIGLSAFGKMADHVRALDLKEGDTVSFIGDPRAEAYTKTGVDHPIGWLSASLQSLSVVDRASAGAAPHSGSKPESGSQPQGETQGQPSNTLW
jgi:hypothetical protein